MNETTLFDQYAQAALTGLLSNSAVATALAVNDTQKIPEKIANAALFYAEFMVKNRERFMKVGK